MIFIVDFAPFNYTNYSLCTDVVAILSHCSVNGDEMNEKKVITITSVRRRVVVRVEFIVEEKSRTTLAIDRQRRIEF